MPVIRSVYYCKMSSPRGNTSKSNFSTTHYSSCSLNRGTSEAVYSIVSNRLPLWRFRVNTKTPNMCPDGIPAKGSNSRAVHTRIAEREETEKEKVLKNLSVATGLSANYYQSYFTLTKNSFAFNDVTDVIRR